MLRPAAARAHPSLPAFTLVFVRLCLGAFAAALTLSGAFVIAARVLPSGGELAYFSTRDGSYNIYLADLATGLSFALIDHPADDFAPAWSPDGARLVFLSDRTGGLELYVIDADGRNLRQLTDNDVQDSGPVWSPDGRQIAFESTRGASNDIYVIDVDAPPNSERRVTYHDSGTYNTRPVWSADGTTLAYYGDDRRDPELFLAHVGAGGITRLTTNRVNDRDPVWSPDGAWLAYFANYNANLDLYLLAVARPGAPPLRLTYHLSRDWMPAWSPDGAALAFVSERSGAAALYVLPLACLAAPPPAAPQPAPAVSASTLDAPPTDPLVPLDSACGDAAFGLGDALSASDDAPVWSSDSRRLAFVSSRDGNLEVYVADAGCPGCAARRITFHPALDRGVVWRP